MRNGLLRGRELSCYTSLLLQAGLPLLLPLHRGRGVGGVWPAPPRPLHHPPGHPGRACHPGPQEAAGDAGSKEDLPVRGHQLPPAPGRLGGHPEANSLLQQQLPDTSASRQDDAASQPGPALLSPLQGSLPGSRQGPAGGQGDLQMLCPEAARPCPLQPMLCSVLQSLPCPDAGARLCHPGEAARLVLRPL